MSTRTADYGCRLDYETKTVVADGTVVTAEEAVTAGPPSLSMFEFAQQVADRAGSLGGQFCEVSADPSADRPGGLRVRWGAGPVPHGLATEVGPVPAWLTLHHDTDTDVRYQAVPVRGKTRR